MEIVVNYVLLEEEPKVIWYTLASLYPIPRQGDVFVYKRVSYDVRNVIISIDDKTIYVVLSIKKDYSNDYLRG